MVKVFRYKRYIGSEDKWIYSERWATKKAIDLIDGVPLEDHAADIDEKYLDGNGMTIKGFDMNTKKAAR